MSATDELLANNSKYARTYPAEPPGRPTRSVAVVACMDARMDVYALLGLTPGEAHVVRNAGGEVTEDVLRSHQMRYADFYQQGVQARTGG